jgi:hypothetical protein
MLFATGKAEFADKIERACFNACPGAVTKNFHQLQYFSSPNQVVLAENSCHTLAAAGGKWMCYRPKPGTECCTGEVNRTMPNYVARMWLRRGNDPVAALYGPSQFSFAAGRTEVTIHEETSYPFAETVDFRIAASRPVRFRLWLRIPCWCVDARLEMNGKALRRKLRPGRFISIQRTFAHGDRIRLVLPMKLKLSHSVDGGVSIERGPLLFALPVRETRSVDRADPHQTKEFPAYSMKPAGRWNYAPCLDERDLDRVEIVHASPSLDPWSHPPIALRVPARRVRGWRLRRARVIDSVGGTLIDPARNKWQMYSFKKRGDFLLTPPLPDPATVPERLAAQEETITLVPYGCTLLRVAVFPEVRRET